MKSFYIYGKYYKSNKKIKLYRYILNVLEKDCYIDHINHNTIDDRKENLRESTNSENQQNRIKPISRNTSGINNLYFDKHHNKWKVIITVKNKTKFEKYYENKEDAVEDIIIARALYMPFSQEAMYIRPLIKRFENDLGGKNGKEKES